MYYHIGMNPFAVSFLIVFGVISLTHLVFCFLELETLRKWTKCFCVLFLGIAALLAAPNEPLIYVGAFLGVIGDFFLIWQRKKPMFMIGTLFFLIGHLLYLIRIITCLSYCASIPIYVYIIIGAVLFCLTFGLYPFTKSLAGVASFGGNFYMPFLIVVFVFSILLAIDIGSKDLFKALFIVVGYFLFFSSDVILIISTYKKDFPRRDFPIMFTYLLAEFGIVFGLLLMVA